MAKKNVWIFGGTGFVGKSLVNYLSNSPNYILNLLVHKNIPYRFLEPFNIFTGKLESFDLQWLDKYPPDIIFHLARLGGRNKPIRYYKSWKGAKANQRIIDYLIQSDLHPVIVYVSSLLMYGNQINGNYAFEDTNLNPLSYAQQFSIAEQPWINAQLSRNLDIRFSRPGWIMGPDSWFKTFYWNYFCETGKIPMYGSGDQLMSLIYVDDLAGQLVNIAENGIRNANLNTYTCNPISQRNFVEILGKELNVPIEEVSLKTLKRKFGVAASEPIISSIQLNTNYKELQNLYVPKYSSVESMIKNTISILHHK